MTISEIQFSMELKKVKKKKQSCPCDQLIKHYAMKVYGGLDV
jgi:hypothetical protein